MENKIIILGDVRYSKIAHELYGDERSENHVKFLILLQKLMKKHGIVKLDVCFDAFAIDEFKTE